MWSGAPVLCHEHNWLVSSCLFANQLSKCHKAIYPSIHPSNVCNHFITFYGATGDSAADNPSCLWARAGYTLDKSPAHRRALTAHQDEVFQFEVQYIAQGHVDMQLSLELGFESATFRSLADLLYPLSYCCSDVIKICKCNVNVKKSQWNQAGFIEWSLFIGYDFTNTEYRFPQISLIFSPSLVRITF